MGYLVTNPFEVFLDRDGNPLDGGYLYFGVANQNPETNPIAIYWDAALTIPAANPVRTINGYPSRNGSPSILYAATNYSITVKGSDGTLVYNRPTSADGAANASGINFELTSQSVEEGSTQQVNDFATARTINPVAGRVIYIKCHTNQSDGGGGNFEAITGAAPGTYVDDNGITILPTGGDGSSCWRRVYSGAVLAAFYGANSALANNATAINAAVAYLSGGGIVELPEGTLDATADINITSKVQFRGQGTGTHLRFSGASLVVSGIDAGAHVTDWSLYNIQVSRIGAVGPAVLFEGDGTAGSNKGAIRFDVDHLKISASTGDGLVMRNTYIGTIKNPFLRGCAGAGLSIKYDTVAGLVSANAVTILGGEIQSNARAIDAEGCAGLFLYGTTIEGNAAGGVDLQANVRQFAHIGGYYEANGGYDIKVGSAASSGYGHTIQGVVFFDGVKAKDRSIELNRSLNVGIRDCSFIGYGLEPIYNNPASGGAVVGVAENCYTDSTALVSSETRYFGRTVEERQLAASAVLDFPSIAAGSYSILTIAVTGAAVGDFCQVSTAANLQGMIASAQCRAAGTVEVTLANNTAGAIDLPAATFNVLVTPKSCYL